MEYCAGKLSFYQEGQLQGTMKIDYLTKICLDRMKLLTQIDNWNNENSTKENEQLQNFGNIDVNLSQLEENILLEAKRCNLAIETSQNQQSINNNLVSHYFCKIAFSIFKPQKLDWFMDQEIILFRARVKKASQYDQKVVLKLLESEGLQIEHINSKNLNVGQSSGMETEYAEDFQSDDEKELIERPKQTEKKGYQIPFYFGLDYLVKQYKINVIGQIAQVPEEYLWKIAVHIFTWKLKESIRQLKAQQGLYFETKLLPVIEAIINNEEYEEQNQNLQQLDFQNFKEYAEKCFAPCMKRVHSHFLQNKHLRHEGRLQYWFFLKSIGMKFQDCFKYIKNIFTQKISEEQFQKQYAYSVRHCYGQVGGGKNYTCYSCTRIIGLPNPSSEEYHGCPFKALSEFGLRQFLLEKYQITDPLQMQKILEKQRERKYDIACLRLYKFVYNQEIQGKFGSPLHWYKESVELLNKPNLLETF